MQILRFIGVRSATRIPFLVFRSGWIGVAGQVTGTNWWRFAVPPRRRFTNRSFLAEAIKELGLRVRAHDTEGGQRASAIKRMAK